MEERIGGRVPLLQGASPLLSEEGWQFRETSKTGCRTYLRMRRGADQDGPGPQLGYPTKSVSTVINDQRLCGLYANIGEETRIVLRSRFEGVDQVRPVEPTK